MFKYLKFIVFISLFISCSDNQDITIHLIGDSTMADKPNPQENPERGWGQMLSEFFKENITVKNHAVNGRSTKSFIDEGRWDKVLSGVNPGDYVFIQFGHNDQKFKDSLRFTNPLTGYKSNLIKFVKDTRSEGGIPVLFTSVVRRKYNEYGILMDTHGLYPLLVKQVAGDLNVPFIDLQVKTENLILSMGQEQSKQLFMWIEPGQYEMYPDGKQDNTHFSVKGASEVARLAIEGISENKLGLLKYLKKNDNLNLN